MKQITFILAALWLFACNKPLDTKPGDFESTDAYFKSEADLDNALTGVYDILGKEPANNLVTLFNTVDETYSASTTGLLVFDYDPGLSTVATVWQRMYQGIERANVLLANVNKPKMDEAKRDVVKGEAKFLRAYYYFLLVQNFGGVPLRDKPTASVNDIYYPRAPADEVYAFIAKEMEEAEALVQPVTAFNHAGRVTKSAVRGVLARVNLYWAGFPNNKPDRYPEALKWAQMAIESGAHSLNPDYSQVFINLIQDKYDTKESIWELEFFTTGVTDPFMERSSVGVSNGITQNLIEYGYSTGQFSIQEKLYRKFENTDLRRDWAIAPYGYVANNAPNKVFWTSTQIYSRKIGKFRREYELVKDKVKNETGINLPLLRYADVLLMAAEAENEVNGPTGKAHQYLNEVRGRAKASLYTGATAIADKDAFRTAVQDERYRELCFEGWRRNDLIRWGILVSTMKDLANYIQQTAPAANRNAGLGGQNISAKHNYFPIPQKELSLNNLLEQNEGW